MDKINTDASAARISPLSREHLPRYAEVIRESFSTVARAFGYTRDNCPTFTGFVADETLAGELLEGYRPFGCFVDGKIVGYVSLHDRGGGIYKMKHLAVLPEYRHFGYGKSLLDFCKAKVAELGGNKITIGIIEENTVLKDWYTANGFVQTGTAKYDGFPSVIGYMEWVT